MLTMLLGFPKKRRWRGVGREQIPPLGPVFVGSAVRVSFIFVEVIGEALDLFVFSEGRW
jgi:hypothetical protein